MPSLITHYLCGEKSLIESDNKPVKDIINNHRQVFNLGTQGPDIFFFYLSLPLSSAAKINNIADIMHKKNVSKFFINAMKYAIEESANTSDILASYLLGFACHYALDSSTHPYINYKSGFLRKGYPKTHKFSFYHHRFEKAIDFLMLDIEKGMKPQDMKIHKLIKVSKNELETIGQMYEKVIYDSYGVTIPMEQVIRSISNMVRAYSLLIDKHGIKSKLLGSLSKHFDWSALAFSYIYPSIVCDRDKYLNLSHSPWCLPWDKSNVQNTSFVELFDNASTKSKELFNIIYNALYNGLDIKNAAQKIGNRSFNTGQDCTLNLDLKYYDCIFE